MKFKSLILAGFLLLAANGMAQTPSYGRAYYPKQTRVPIWLDLSAGLNAVDCYDAGTVPFKYIGMGPNVGMGVTIEWGRCHIRPGFRYFSNILKDPSGTAIGLDFSTEFLYRFVDGAQNRFHLWAGGTLQGFFDTKSIPSLQNAATCISLFGNVGATAMVQYDFAFNPDKNHNWLTAYFKLNVPLYGVVNRPGYAYIGNPAINEDAVETLFGEKEAFGKFFPGLNTDLGLYLNLLNGNRIGLTYRWDYVSTGKKGTYRYDNALHSVNVSFMFRLN